MEDPKFICVNYIRKTERKDNACSVGFAYDSRFCLSCNIDNVIEFVKLLHSVERVVSVNLEY